MQREFPLVIRKTGEQFIATFPIILKAGDQLILTREIAGSQVPEGKTWTIEGYSRSGPKIKEVLLCQ